MSLRVHWQNNLYYKEDSLAVIHNSHFFFVGGTLKFSCNHGRDFQNVLLTEPDALCWLVFDFHQSHTFTIRESVDSLCRDGADAQYMQYLSKCRIHGYMRAFYALYVP